MPPRVRSRTLAHLDKLLAMSALAAACHSGDPGYGVVDPMPLPAQDDPPKPPTSTIPEASGTTPPPETATPPSTNPPTTTTPTTAPPDIGYGVVDPMPPPADCTSLPEALWAYATFENGTMNVVININGRYRTHATLDARADLKPDHGTVSAVAVSSSAWTFNYAPDAAFHTVTMPVSGTCEGKAQKAKLRLSWDGPLAKDTRIEALVVDEGR